MDYKYPVDRYYIRFPFILNRIQYDSGRSWVSPISYIYQDKMIAIGHSMLRVAII